MSEVLLKKPTFEAFLETQPSIKFVDLDDAENPKERRRKRNRISSEEHRKRKRRYIALLENQVFDLSKENSVLKDIVLQYELNLQLQNLNHENWCQYDPNLNSSLQ